jgi:FkbM family methyltransferase
MTYTFQSLTARYKKLLFFATIFITALFVLVLHVSGKNTLPVERHVVQLTLLELGSNDGAWMEGMCNKFLDLKGLGGSSDFVIFEGDKIGRMQCFMFDADPLHRDKRNKIAKRCGCKTVDKVVGIEDDVEISFHASKLSGGIGSSVYNDGVYTTNDTSHMLVHTVDISKWIEKNLQKRSETNRLLVRMDIEGSEYDVIRRMITSNVACSYIDTLQFEVHAMYAVQNHNKRPVDVTVPWLLNDCGVQTDFESYYGLERRDPKVMETWPADDNCTPEVCPLLYRPIE